jgi:hypothetical protein
MRTINEVLRIIQEADPESAITANCIRSLCKKGTVRSVQIGNKTLVNLDDFLRVIGFNEELKSPIAKTNN